jgi:hypothetical protein
MITKILVSVLVMVFAWTVCDVGDVQAEGLSDIPSTGEIVAVGLGVAAVITLIVVIALNAGDDEDAKEDVEDLKTKEEISNPQFEPVSKGPVRMEPMVILQERAMGAGLSLSF